MCYHTVVYKEFHVTSHYAHVHWLHKGSEYDSVEFKMLVLTCRMAHLLVLRNVIIDKLTLSLTSSSV